MFDSKSQKESLEIMWSKPLPLAMHAGEAVGIE